MTQVSVIVPTYNRASLLGRALTSILAQSRPAQEIIVIDDGSTDETHGLVAGEFPSARYIRQSNRGVSAARNRGIEHAQGSWIAFLDSDDEWAPEKLEKQFEALERSPSYEFCHTGETWVRGGRRVNPMKKHANAGGHIFRRCLPLCVISPSSVLMSRALLSRIGPFDESLPACEDYDMWLRVCATEPVLYLDRPLVVKYGGHADQLSRRHWGMDRYRIRALEKIIASGNLSPPDREAAIEQILAKIEVYLNGAAKRGKEIEAAEYEAKRERFHALLAGSAPLERA